MENVMLTIKLFPRIFLVLVIASSLNLSGCGSYMPWFGDEADEEEDFLSFENEAPLEEEAESKEEDPFASEESMMAGDEEFGDESGFASIDQLGKPQKKNFFLGQKAHTCIPTHTIYFGRFGTWDW